MTPDNELLRRYAETRSEDAFAELVRRHVNLVYSAALRQVGDDAHLAKDVSQTVFADLARKAGSLARWESLTGWLYTSAHFAAAKIARTENRRRNREEKFMREPTNESRAGVSPAQSPDETDWEKVRPAIDDAMHELADSDREAILLRYFENRQFVEVGAKFGLNENAARMRVERALEKLRAIFAKHGITTTAALASVISANAVQTAPAGLAATLASASVAAVGTGTAFTILKFMTATHIKLGLSALVVAGAATAMVVQHQTQTQLRGEDHSLRQQISQLQADNESLSNRLASIGQAKSLTDEQLNELLRLRSEVGQFWQQTNQLTARLAELERGNRQLRLEMKNMQKQAMEKFPVLTNVTLFKEHQKALFGAAGEIYISMRLYADDNGGIYPTNLDQITNDLAGEVDATNLSSDFEMANPGLASVQFPQMPVLKERTPLWWGGQWERVYVLDDSSILWISSDNGDFSGWEKKQLALALGTTNQSR